MGSLAQTLKPQRLHGETHQQYRDCRKEGNAAVKKFLKGRLIWRATKLVPLNLDEKGLPAVPGSDAEVVHSITLAVKDKGTYQMRKHGPIGTPRHNFRNNRRFR